MIALLPLECTLKIFNDFRHNTKTYYKTLFSCALVSRQWCRVVIPILWNEPKHYFQEEAFTEVLLLTLNYEERELLNSFKINIPKEPTPLFEYTSYITSVTKDMYDGVKIWLTKRYEAAVGTEHEDNINHSLVSMFLRTGQNLKYLYLDDINCSKIIIKNTPVTSVDLHFSEEVNLEYKYKSLDGLVTNLDENTTLTSLNIISDILGKDGLKIICKGLTKTYLNSFGIYQYRIGNKDVKIFATFLRKNITLTTLNLCGRSLKKEIGAKVGNRLAEALCKNKTLKNLQIQYYNFGLEEGRAFADVLCKNSTLISLDLGHNNLRSEGGEALADALCKNSTLTSLNLGHNLIGSQGEKALAKALCENTTLTSLNLADNLIVLEGALADALCKNTTLISLNLGRNNLGSKEGQVLADVLCKNTTLNSLDFEHNKLGSNGGKTLAKIFSNISLKDLNLKNNKIGLEGKKALKDALQLNAKLTSFKLRV